MDENIIVIEAQESGERIDALLARSLEGFSRNAVQKLTEDGRVLFSGSVIKKNRRTERGEHYTVILPEPELTELRAENIPLDIVYEDENIIVINKPRGLVVHPAPGHPDGTLVNALMYHCGASLSGIGGEIRPGIVHRIDKDTSGLIAVAKNDAAHRSLASQLSEHTMFREYEAVVRGEFKTDSGTVDAPVGRHRTDRKRMAVTEYNSKPAITHWQVIAGYRGYTHIACRLETGRTHQIRVHMSYIGHPLLGDSLYGGSSPEKGLEGQCLHACRLTLTHPGTGEEMTFCAPLPDYFKEVISKLGNRII